MQTDEEISKLGDPCERLYQRCTNALHGAATIEASVIHRGGNGVVRTTEYVVTANSGNVLDPVTIKDNVEWRIPTELAGKWKKARRTYDIDVFKREVVQRSGHAITPEVAEQWGEALDAEKNYGRYKDLKAKYMSQAVRSHK